MLLTLLSSTAFSGPVFNVRDYGARGDNSTDDTGAFEKAIAAAAGGGQLLVPAGGVYLIRPINLTSSLEFYIQGGATVAGTLPPLAAAVPTAAVTQPPSPSLHDQASPTTPPGRSSSLRPRTARGAITSVRGTPRSCTASTCAE